MFHKFRRLILTGTTASLVATVPLSTILLGSYTPAQASEEVDRYTLCSRFPLNSRCEGYEAPVSLKQRSGDEGFCSLISGEIDLSGKCKVVITDDKITAYLEEGKGLEVLDGKKPTQTINIVLSDIVNMNYQNYKKTNVGRLVGNTLLFGLLGAVFTNPDKLSQIEIGFNEKLVSKEPGSKTFSVVADRDIGVELRAKLERLTGIFAEVPPEEAEEEALSEPVIEETQNREIDDLDEFCKSYPYNSRCKNLSVEQ